MGPDLVLGVCTNRRDSLTVPSPYIPLLCGLFFCQLLCRLKHSLSVGRRYHLFPAAARPAMQTAVRTGGTVDGVSDHGSRVCLLGTDRYGRF